MLHLQDDFLHKTPLRTSYQGKPAVLQTANKPLRECRLTQESTQKNRRTHHRRKTPNDLPLAAWACGEGPQETEPPSLPGARSDGPQEAPTPLSPGTSDQHCRRQQTSCQQMSARMILRLTA